MTGLPFTPFAFGSGAVEQAPDGSLRDLDPEELAVICKFSGDASDLWTAMTDCGFIETQRGRSVICSWTEHQGKLIERAERNAARMRGARAQHEADTSSATDVTDGRNETDERDETKAAADSPVLLTFPTDGRVKSWDLTEARIAEWSPLFPKLDILDECRQALAWVGASPDHRKTAGGMPRFLVGWFGRSTNSGRPQATTRGAVNLAALQAGGRAETVPEFSVPERLTHLAEALPEAIPARSRWSREIAALKGSPEEVESLLRKLDAKLLGALREEAGADVLSGFAAKAAAQVKRFGIDQAAGSQLEAQWLRSHFSAPVLSLFSPEAHP